MHFKHKIGGLSKPMQPFSLKHVRSLLSVAVSIGVIQDIPPCSKESLEQKFKFCSPSPVMVKFFTGEILFIKRDNKQYKIEQSNET